MRPSVRPAIAIVTLLFLTLAGCVPTSEHPVGNGSDAPVDPALFGIWTGPIGDRESYVHILPSSRPANDPLSKGLDLLFVSHPTEDDPEDSGWVLAHGYAAQIDGRRYLSVKWDLADGEPQTGEDAGYHILEYRLPDAGRMEFRSFDEDAIVEAIEAGRIDGTVVRGQFLRSIRLKAAPEALRAFLSEGDPDSLFGPFADPLIRANP